jgi:archaellum component FlaC
MSAKKITIDKLAGMTKRGFDRVDERLDKVDEKLNRVDEKFNRVDERFNNINARLDVIEGDLKEIKEEMVRSIDFEDLKSRVELLEKKTGIIS